MIASVSGTAIAVSPDGVVVEVGGVGLRIQCNPATVASFSLGMSVRLATSLVVREDSLTLFGFASQDERDVFELLQTASGVGPRLALAILGVHNPVAIRRAISTSDIPALTQVPGIGKKGAERLVLELKDRLGPAQSATVTESLAGPVVARQWREQVREALVSLGWSTREAEQTVSEVAAVWSEGGEPSVSQALKLALGLLGRSR